MRTQRGLTLVELMIGVAITTMLIMMAGPSLTTLVRNRQIRSSAESISDGLQLARGAAISRNATVMFSLSSSADNSCALAATGPNWVVSQDDPSGACAATASDTVPPRIIQKQASAQSTATNQIAATQNAVAYNGPIVFNGFGRVTPIQAADIWIDVTNPSGGDCGTASGAMRCMRVVVSPGGMIRLCDANVAYSATHTQGC